METVKNLVVSHPYLSGLVAVAATHVLYRQVTSRRRKSVTLDEAPPNTVVLHQIPRRPFAPSLSPYPLKLETFLRLAGIPYQNKFGKEMSTKGKTPWISYNGQVVADSQIAIEFLCATLGVDLYRPLTPQQRALAHATRVLVDEHLYWCLVYFRYIYDREQTCLRLAWPRYLRYVITHRLIRPQLYGQGMGRHSAHEVKVILMQDLQALADLLGEKPFLMGESPTDLDCSAFGMLAQFVYHCQDDVTGGLIQEKFPSLHKFCERMRDRLWPDWDDCTTRGGTVKATK